MLISPRLAYQYNLKGSVIKYPGSALETPLPKPKRKKSKRAKGEVKAS